MNKSGWYKKPQNLLAVALALIFIGSFLGQLFHTSFYSVDIKKIAFETERGVLTGLLYMPKGAGENDPRPVIVTTHGYLNSKEMQDAPAIEMSRRGYIVLALDMYDHGDSRWAADIPAGSQFSTFWIYAQIDAVRYIYHQSYTLKDKDGNGYIAVSGHSMGGFSSILAMYWDELTALQTGVRMIYAGIPTGADLSYAAMVAPSDQLLAALGSRTVGVVAAHYDEFFFNKSDAEKTEDELAVKGTVVYKDYPATLAGKAFLGLTAADQAGEQKRFYDAESGDMMAGETMLRESQTGARVIYTPTETHPWNHFSKAATENLIHFYTHAFSGVLPPSITGMERAETDQIWIFKEIFNMIALAGFFMLILPVASLLMKLPLLRRVNVLKDGLDKPSRPAWASAVGWLAVAVGTLLPALLFPMIMDKQAEGMASLRIAAIAAGGLCLVMLILGVLKDKRAFMQGGAVTVMLSVLLWAAIQFAPSIARLGAVFIEPTVNQIVYWAIFSGLLTALLIASVHFFIFKPIQKEDRFSGITLNAAAIGTGLLVAVLTVAAAYTILFLMQTLFGVDFRIWTLAVRTFKAEHLLTSLRYMPFFLLFYFFNAVTIFVNAGNRKAGPYIAVLMNVTGLILWVAYQYGQLFMKGVAAYPDQALNAILLFALIPCLGMAGIYANRLAHKTGNVWLAAFLNTLLFTVMTCTNTAMFWNMV